MAKVAVKKDAQPKLLVICAAVSNVAAQWELVPEVVWTSGIDGVHSYTSRHYALEALDVRSKNFPNLASKLAFKADLEKELGPDYLVLFEHEGKENEHFHIQFKR